MLSVNMIKNHSTVPHTLLTIPYFILYDGLKKEPVH